MGFRGSFQYYHQQSFKDFLASVHKKTKVKQEQLIIEEAIKLGKQSSKAPGTSRGSGLPLVLETIMKSLQGYVIIHSLSGYYQKGRNQQTKEIARSDIRGTLVQFGIPKKIAEGDAHMARLEIIERFPEYKYPGPRYRKLGKQSGE